MPETTRYRQLQDVASRLDISASTLHRWTDEFAEFLSPEAVSAEKKQSRQYTDQDLTALITIKGLMSEGLSYDQVREHLSKLETGNPESAGDEVSSEPSLALVPAVAFMTDTLQNVADSQKAVLNSQAANRELLGVVLQDNFNLKEENKRLRERMLELEQTINQVRRDEEARREMLRAEVDSRLQDIRHLVMLQSRSGCLGGLFGGGQ